MGNRLLKGRFPQLLVLAAFALPIILFWIYCVFINPFRNYFTRDTEFQYFLNSLAVFKGQPYVYVDHPGTPVEVIGSLILGGRYLVLQLSPEAFIDFHLRNPGTFLGIAHYFMILTHLMTMCIFFCIARRSGHLNDAILAAALASMYFALHDYSLRGSVLWNHNAFGFPFGTLLSLVLFHVIARDPADGEISGWTLFGLGIGAGVLAAVTIYFISWVIGILVTVCLYYRMQNLRWTRTLRAAFLLGISSLAGFCIGVAPVLNRMPGFWAWAIGILSHKGNYLAVPDGEPFLERVARNLLDLYQLLPVLSIVIILLTALLMLALWLLKDKLRQGPGPWALAVGATVQVLVLALTFLDRPLRPYYFLSVAATVPVLALALVRIYEASPSISRALNSCISLLVFLGLLLNSSQNIETKKREMGDLVKTETLIPELVREQAARLDRSPEDITILWMNGSYSTCWALWSANRRAGNVFDAEIARICPNQFEFGQRVLLPGEKVPLELARWDMLFTCKRYLDDVLAKEPAVRVRHYPSVLWNCGEMAVVYNE